MAEEYWLSDEAWASIEPHLPNVYAGIRRSDDCRIISAITHVLRGCRWKKLVEDTPQNRSQAL